MAGKVARPMIELYDAFTHGALSRRDFMDRLARIAGGAAAATALLPVLANDYAHAAPLVAEDDDRLETFTRKFDTGGIVDLIEPEEILAEGAPNGICRSSQRMACGRRTSVSRRPSSSFTKIAASIRISATSRAASRSRAFMLSRLICCRPMAARRTTKKRRARRSAS